MLYTFFKGGQWNVRKTVCQDRHIVAAIGQFWMPRDPWAQVQVRGGVLIVAV